MNFFVKNSNKISSQSDQDIDLLQILPEVSKFGGTLILNFFPLWIFKGGKSSVDIKFRHDKNEAIFFVYFLNFGAE